MTVWCKILNIGQGGNQTEQAEFTITALLPEWETRSVMWATAEPSVERSIFFTTTSRVSAPTQAFWDLSSRCCLSSCRRWSRSFSLWSEDSVRMEDREIRWRWRRMDQGCTIHGWSDQGLGSVFKKPVWTHYVCNSREAPDSIGITFKPLVWKP